MSIEMALLLPVSMNYCRIFAKKWTLEMLAVSFWGFSNNNTVFCLHGFVRVSKNSVSGELPVHTLLTNLICHHSLNRPNHVMMFLDKM